MAKSFEEVRARLLKNPKVKVEYDRLGPEYELAETIIKARADAGLTQEQLAARMGTSQAHIARLESGRVLPSARTWMRLAEATGTRPKFLLEPSPRSRKRQTSKAKAPAAV